MHNIKKTMGKSASSNDFEPKVSQPFVLHVKNLHFNHTTAYHSGALLNVVYSLTFFISHNLRIINRYLIFEQTLPVSFRLS